MSGRTGVALAIAVWVVARLIMSSGLGAGAVRKDVQEDCLADECAADGLALSLYAG